MSGRDTDAIERVFQFGAIVRISDTVRKAPLHDNLGTLQVFLQKEREVT